MDPALDDQLLVRRFLGGDEAAFAEIIQAHHPRIRNALCKILRDRQDAEEVAQDVFIRAHRGLVRFRGDCSLGTWLYRIAVNLARNRYWYCRRRGAGQHDSIEGIPGMADTLRDPGVDVHRDIEIAEVETRAVATLEHLRRNHREILTMRWERHMSYDEIAAAMGCGIGTVKSRLNRARANLERRLAA